jgi:tetratricopeptide (TPR) repeat protein
MAQQLTRLYPMFPGGFVSLARAHHGLASAFLAKEQFEIAVTELKLAAEAAAKAVKLSPEQQNFRVQRVVQKQLATVLEKSGDRSGAETAFVDLIQISEEQLKHGSSPENMMSTAGDYLRLVKYQTFTGKHAEAIASLERAIELFGAIPQWSPLFPTAQSFLEKSKSDLAELRVKQPWESGSVDTR